MRVRPHIRTLATIAALTMVPLALAACGSSSGSSGSATTNGVSVTASKAWARSTARSQTTAAVYLTVVNDSGNPVVLTGASVPATVAASAAMHETMSTSSTTMASGSGMSGTDDMTTMHEVATITVKPRTTFMFEPGAHHIMLMDLAHPLAAGDEFPITLTRRRGPSLQATVKVRSV